MVEWKITAITCAHDIYEEILYIEKHFNNWFSLSRDKKRRDTYYTMIALLNKRIYEYIIANCNVRCSEKQAEIMWKYCETQHEDDPHNYIDDVIELFEKLMEADK